MKTRGWHVNNTYRLWVILFLGALTIAGCANVTPPIGGKTAGLPLNEGVGDLSFLSSSEVEILETINKTRGTGTAAASLVPLKTSKGLSFASRERAEELARSNRPVITKDQERNRLFERVRKFGTWSGTVAEVASYGYSGSAVVTELMKSSAAGQQPQPYFMDAIFTVMGVGCTSAGYPAPICVITFASEFNESVIASR